MKFAENKILHGDCLDILPRLPSQSFNCCVTSPPYYGLRDYGVSPYHWPEVVYAPMPGMSPVDVPSWNGCLGQEPTLSAFVGHMVLIFRKVWDVLRDDGTLWLNLGDTYASKWSTSRRNVIGLGSMKDGGRSNRPNRMTDGLKEKDLMGVPWRVAMALQADGWLLGKMLFGVSLIHFPKALQIAAPKLMSICFC